MQNHQLIRKIKELRQIKPTEEWVFLTKERILKRRAHTETVPFSSVFSFLFQPIRKPIFAVAPLVVLAAVLGGFFVYNIIEQGSGNQETNIIASLERLEKNLSQITSDLNGLKTAKDTNQALVMTEIVKATAKQGEEIVDLIKSTTKFKPNHVLASLNGVGEAYKELEEEVNNTQVEMIKDYIEYLKQTSLTEEDQERLELVEEYYNEGKYIDAMILIQKIEIN